jgi:hypothetical protein
MIGALYFGQYFPESATLSLPSGEAEVMVLEIGRGVTEVKLESVTETVELENGSSQIEPADNIIESEL